LIFDLTLGAVIQTSTAQRSGNITNFFGAKIFPMAISLS
jgi:hypothetical protein